MQQKIIKNLRIIALNLFITCFFISINTPNAHAYFFEGEWEVSIEGRTQQGGVAVEVPNSPWPSPNQTRSYIWDIRRDGDNVYILSAEDPNAYGLDTLIGRRKLNDWRRLSVSDVSYDSTKLLFNIHEAGRAGKPISITRVYLLPKDGDNLIGGQWQYEYSINDAQLGLQHVQRNGVLYMRRKK